MCVHTSHRCYKCPPFTLRPWQWTHEYPWCRLYHFCYPSTRCQFPCEMKIITRTSFNHIPFFLSIRNSNVNLLKHFVFTKDGIRTLPNLVIVNPTWMNLFCQSCITWGFVASKVAQAKKKRYCNRDPIDHFFFLAIEVFGCLNKQDDMFSHDCANAMWNFKGPLSILVTFLCQKISITLQRMHKHPPS